MKYLLILLLMSEVAFAHGKGFRKTKYVEPGQCIWVHNTKVCAVQQHVETEPTSIEQITAYCSLEKYGSNPSNMWVLYQMTTTNKGKTRKTRLKAFPHFEKSNCESEAKEIQS